MHQASQGRALAITATAAYACQELSIPYLKLEDYCRYSQRFDEYDQILSDYLDWETWLDDWSQGAILEFQGTGFRPAKAVTYFLQFLLTEIWSTSTNLIEFLRATKPTKIAYWSPKSIE